MKTDDNDKFDGDVAVDENIDKFCDRMYVAGIKSINNDAITIDDTMMLLYMTTMINMMVMVMMFMFMLTTTSTNSLTECMWPVASTKSSGLSCCSISHIPEMLVIVVINMLKQFMINAIFNITTTSSSP